MELGADCEFRFRDDVTFVPMGGGVEEAVRVSALRTSPLTWTNAHEGSATAHLITSSEGFPFGFDLSVFRIVAIARNQQLESLNMIGTLSCLDVRRC